MLMHRQVSLILATLLLTMTLNAGALRAQDDADEVAVRKLVEQFFDAYSKKHLDGMMACWSAKSPMFADFKQFAHDDLTALEEIQFAKLTFRHWQIETNQAFVRLQFNRKWREAVTNQLGEENTILDVQFVKESTGWKFRQLSNAVDEFAAILGALKSKDERAELLKTETELVTVELVITLCNVGATQASQGKFDEALRLSDISFEVAEVLGETTAKGHCYLSRGDIFNSQSKYQEALTSYQRALPLFQDAKDKLWEAWTLIKLGQIYEQTSKYTAALAQYEASLKIAREIGGKNAEAAAHDGIGTIYQLTGKHTEALAQYEMSLKITREIKDKENEAKTLSNIGNVYQSTGQYAEGLARYEAGLKIEREIGDRAGEAGTLSNIGNIYQATGKYTEALTRFEASLKIKKEIGDRAGEADTVSNIGLIYQATGKYAEALSRFEASLKVMREIGDRAVEAKMLNNIGTVHQLTGSCPEASAKYDESLKITREIGDKNGEANALGNIGLLYQATGKYADALARYEASLKIEREIADRAGEASTLNNTGNIYQLTGKYPEALKQYQTSLSITRGIGDRPGEASTLGNIGLVYRLTGKYPEALVQYEASLKIEREIGDRPGEAQTLNNIGVIYQLTGKYAEALTRFEASLEIKRNIGDRSGEASTLGNIGNIYDLTGKYAEALVQYEASLKMAREIGDRVGEITSLVNIAVAYRFQKQWQLAAEAYKKAIPLIESIRAQTKEPSLQTGFFAQYVSPYYGLIESLLELGSKRDEIFAVSERAKARTLVEMMTGNKINILKSMTDAERERERELKANLIAASVQLDTAHSRSTSDQRRIEELKEQLNKARDDYAEFRVKLFIAHPELQVQRGSYDPVALAQLSEPLFAKDPKLCLLSYLVGDNKTFLIVITGSKNSSAPVNVAVYKLKSDQDHELTANELKGLLSEFRQRCANESGLYKPLARDLYRLLLAPARNELKDSNHLVIIPDGMLHLLPFQALIDEQGKHFIESHTVSYAPSVTALIQMMKLAEKKRRANTSIRPLFAMGRGTFPDQSQYRNLELPMAEEQVKSIARLFGVTAWTGTEATKARAMLEMGTTRYVHFATHGELNEVAPMESAIVLARSANDDGMLYARDFVDMELQADLVVLSACDTGLGQPISGEGIMGLTWALFVAGTPTTVVTQWKVRDDSMNRMMLEFYRQMRLPGANGRPAITKAEALRRAQLSLMMSRGFEHPYYWAPVALVGDWR
jgi:CHAT domain-containing protein/Tfp pilus assembly protein PilF